MFSSNHTDKKWKENLLVTKEALSMLPEYTVLKFTGTWQ